MESPLQSSSYVRFTISAFISFMFFINLSNSHKDGDILYSKKKLCTSVCCEIVAHIGSCRSFKDFSTFLFFDFSLRFCCSIGDRNPPTNKMHTQGKSVFCICLDWWTLEKLCWYDIRNYFLIPLLLPILMLLPYHMTQCSLVCCFFFCCLFLFSLICMF